MYFGTLNVNLKLSVTLNKFTLPPHIVWSVNKQLNALLGLLFKGTGQWKRVIYTRLFLQFGNLSIKIYKERPLIILVVIIHNILCWSGLEAPHHVWRTTHLYWPEIFQPEIQESKVKDRFLPQVFFLTLINTTSALHMTSS